MSSLRILHVVPYYEQAWAYGGIPRLATTLTHALARRGHEIAVYTTDVCDAASRALAPAVDTARPDAPRVRMFRNLSNRLAYRWQFFTPIGLAAHLRRTVRRYDVAHLHACHNLPTSVAASILARSGVPYVLAPNGTAPWIERRVRLKRLYDFVAGAHVIPGASCVLAVSEAERRQLQRLGVPETRIALVPNPIDEREFEATLDAVGFRRAHRLGTAPLVLYLGKLTPRKGVDVLVRAFARIRPDARLVIAGNDMGSLGRTMALARSLEVERRVVVAGLLRGSERLAALAAADVLAYPSHDEVFGLVPLESLLSGTPVVVCNDSGCGEVVGSVGGGHIVPPGDPEALAGAIESILGSPAIWRGRARRAAERARARFGSDIVAERLERVYTDIRAAPPGHRRTA